jgi:hypothetical protein
MVMLKRSLIAGFVAIAFLLAGCGAQPGKTMVSYNKGKTPPPLVSAQKSANYALYASNGFNPIWTGPLSEGDKYGFRNDAAGKVWAVAGSTDNIPLESTLATAYYWKQQDKK